MNAIIPIDIYNHDLMVHFGSKKSLVDSLSKYVSKKAAEASVKGIEGVTCGHMEFSDRLGVYYIWMPNVPNDNSSWATLQHEIFHFVVALMKKVGIPLSDDTEEAYAYLIGYVTKSVVDKFRIS